MSIKSWLVGKIQKLRDQANKHLGLGVVTLFVLVVGLITVGFLDRYFVHKVEASLGKFDKELEGQITTHAQKWTSILEEQDARIRALEQKIAPDSASKHLHSRELFRPTGHAEVIAVFPSTRTSDPILRGLRLLPPQVDHTLTANCSIQWIVEPTTSPEDTVATIQQRLEDSNVVLVIGHQDSSTVKFLNTHLYESRGIVDAYGSVPLILPAATNPSLTRTATKEERHILRLPATDDLQVKRLRALINADGVRSKTCLLVDVTNETYSDYIAKQLVADPLDPVDVVDSIGIGLSKSGYATAVLFPPKIDDILFIGMEVQADILLRRMCLQPLTSRARLIFTDGVAGESFQELTTRTLNNKQLGAIKSILVTGPFPVDPVIKRGDLLPKGELPDFEPYGRAARKLAEQLVEEATRAPGGLTRNNVFEALQRYLGGSEVVELTPGMAAKFDEYGDNLKGEMHVFEKAEKKATHYVNCPCK